MFFSIFIYNINAFNKTAEQSEEQAALRLISFRLTKELRNIRYIDLSNYSFSDSSEIAAADPADSFIFSSGNLVKKGDATSIAKVSDTEISGMSFSLRKKTVGLKDKYFLGITLTGKHSAYTTEVLLNNIIAASQTDAGDIGAGGFTSVQYNNTDPMPG
jgi:hypothetical protein